MLLRFVDVTEFCCSAFAAGLTLDAGRRQIKGTTQPHDGDDGDDEKDVEDVDDDNDDDDEDNDGDDLTLDAGRRQAADKGDNPTWRPTRGRNER